MLDESIEDLSDAEGNREIEQKKNVETKAAHERVNEGKEDRSVDEIEAIGAFAEVVDRAAGEKFVEGSAIHRKDDQHDGSCSYWPVEQIFRN